jgi:hypothetical protein
MARCLANDLDANQATRFEVNEIAVFQIASRVPLPEKAIDGSACQEAAFSAWPCWAECTTGADRLNVYNGFLCSSPILTPSLIATS